MDSKRTQDPPVHNFFQERKWLFYLSGHSSARNASYFAFIALIYLFLVYMIVMTSIAGFLISEDMELTVHCIHLCLLLVYSLWVVTTRRITDQSLRITLETINRGFYKYENEKVDEESLKIIMKGTQLSKRRANTLAGIYYFIGFSNTFVIPFVHMLVGSHDVQEYRGINPHLPNPFYLPLDMDSFLGFWTGFLLNGLASLIIYGVVISSTDIFISCTVQLKAQLEVLNHSLRTITKRALAVYLERTGGLRPELRVGADIFKDAVFSDCLLSCLRANVQHHHVLLKFKKTFNSSYVGATLLNVVTVASMVYASHLYLIIAGGPLYMMVNYILTLLAEMTYPLFLCYYGEEVIKESNNIYKALYDTPWMYADKRFAKMIRIMMAYTLNPIKIFCLIFKVTSSLQTFGDSIAGMYKIVNVLRK
nr:olfactory receptor 73 [Tropidothorax elegans]